MVCKSHFNIFGQFSSIFSWTRRKGPFWAKRSTKSSSSCLETRQSTADARVLAGVPHRKKESSTEQRFCSVESSLDERPARPTADLFHKAAAGVRILSVSRDNFCFKIFAIDGREMATYIQSFKGQGDSTRQWVNKFVFQKSPIFSRTIIF